MEDELTLDELMATYRGMMEKEYRQTKNFARVMGVMPDDEEQDGESDFDRVARRVGLKSDKDKSNDITDNPIRGKGGEKFGVGSGIGYKTF